MTAFTKSLLKHLFHSPLLDMGWFLTSLAQSANLVILARQILCVLKQENGNRLARKRIIRMAYT